MLRSILLIAVAFIIPDPSAANASLGFARSDCVMSIRVEFDSEGHKQFVISCFDWGSCLSPDPCTEVQVDGVSICDCGSDADNRCCEIGYERGAFGNVQPTGVGVCPSPCAPPPCAISFIADDPSLPPAKQEGEWVAECGGV